MTIPQLVDFYGSRGFGAIAVTDHLCEERTFLGRSARLLDRTLTRETFPQYLRVLEREAERAWDRYRMRVIPGFELTKNAIINTRSGHIVVLGARQYISADQDIFSLLKQVRELGAISIAAHPVSTGRFEPQTYFLWSRRRELATHFDAWEVASGPRLFKAVAESGLPMVASSDLHHPSQISSWKTRLSCSRDEASILDSIRTQKVDFVFYAEKAAIPAFQPQTA